MLGGWETYKKQTLKQKKGWNCFVNKTNKVTKYTRYISENYFTVSYKALFYIIASKMGMTPKLWK